MIIKESEANHYVCPIMTANSSRDKNVGCLGCLGKECMMWRWYNGIRNYGYCGLAGKVEQGEAEPLVKKKP